MSRINAEGEIIWWVNTTQWQRNVAEYKYDGLCWSKWWLYPCCMTCGDDGTLVVAGMTDDPPVSGDLIRHEPGISIDAGYGVMHIVKLKDPAGFQCPEPYIPAAILLLPLYVAWRRRPSPAA